MSYSEPNGKIVLPCLDADNADCVYLLVDFKSLKSVNDYGLAIDINKLLRSVNHTHTAAGASCKNDCDIHKDYLYSKNVF